MNPFWWPIIIVVCYTVLSALYVYHREIGEYLFRKKGKK